MKNKVLIAIGLLFILNFLTWAFWGRDSILAVPAYEFKTAGTCFADTVYVFTGLEDRP